MADIRAFRGMIYNSSVKGGMNKLVAPPYDVIDEEEQKRLLRLHPHNVVRLILPEDKLKTNDYPWQAKARSFYEEWKSRGVFKSSLKPSIYVYRQDFPLPEGGRRNRIALINLYKIENFGTNGIYPHEQTFSEVTEEQLNLLRHCRASFSQIFSLFKDDKAFWLCLEDKILPSSRLLYRFTTDDGILHELMELSDASVINELRSYMSDKKIFIADGHHRYETALLYRDERREKEKTQEERPYDFALMAFVGINDPGLVMLPVHRLIKSFNLPPEEALRKLERSCSVERVGDTHNKKALDSVTSQVVRRAGKTSIFGLIIPGGIFLIRPKRKIMVEDIAGRNHSEKWRRLDIAILHEVVMKNFLGLGDVDSADKGYFLKYTIDTQEMVKEILSGNYQMGFLVKPPSLEDAWSISARGEKLPHKSTYFYPKIPSGLVIYDHTSGFSAD